RARRVAALGEVACPGGGTADGAGRHERVGRTVVARPVAALRHVADVGRGAADRRPLRIGGARRARPVTALLEVAGAGCGTTGGAGGDEAVGRTGVADTVAALRHVADACRRTADRRALRIGRAGPARARAGLL